MTTTKDDGQKPPPGVQRVWKTLADGSRKAYDYHRATGLALTGEPGSLQYKMAYREAERQALRGARPEREPFAVLLDGFLKSPEHINTAAATRAVREKYIEIIRARFDHLYVEDLEHRRVRSEFHDWRDEMMTTPGKADMAVQTLARVLSWAEKRGKIDVNHARGIGRLTPPGQNRSGIVWTTDERSSLMEAATPQMRFALRFVRFAAPREADLVKLGPSHLDQDGWLTWTPQKTANKTGVVVSLPTFALAPFAELLDEMPKHGKAFILSTWDKPYSVDGFRARFFTLRRQVFGPKFGKNFHDFRGTTATDLSLAGCTEPEIAAVMGWVIGGEVKMAKNYIKRVRELALNAFNKWQAAAFAPKGVVVPIRRS